LGDAIQQLRRSRDQLSKAERFADDGSWFEEYGTEFQKHLDDAAFRRVGDCAEWVGWKTAFAPHPLVDVIITSYWSFVMLRDLCVIYNVRVGSLGTLALLWRAFFNTYVAGRLEATESYAEAQLDKAVHEYLPGLEDFLPGVARKGLEKIAVKAGVGIANLLLIRRLGKKAISMLQPLAT
jgi:uncharacterized membrane protein YcjF (UPF0283 family)